MGKRRIARAGLLIAFTISLCELSRACGGFLGTEIKVVKAADTKDVVSEITNEKIAKITKAFSVILESGTKEFFEGYPVDMSFLSWVQKNYGTDAIVDIAYELFEGNHDSETWYEYTGDSIHVLWLKYCRSLNYSSRRLENILWKEDTEDRTTTISILGDTSFAENWCTTEAMLERENGIWDCVSDDIFKILQADDITMLNHEFTLTESDDAVQDKGYNFKASTSDVDIWRPFDVDLMALANNHVFDYKEQGLLDTIQTLKEAGYTVLGAGKNLDEASGIQYVVMNGRKLAFINASEIERTQNFTQAASQTQAGVFKCLNQELLIQQINKAEKNADYVIVYIHWGFEGGLTPDARMVSLATEMVNAGADTIIGGHPHRLQGVDFIDDVPVAYSIGNFWFSSGSLYTTIAQIQINGKGELSLSMLPCVQRNMTTSLITDAKEKEAFYQYLADISFDVGIDPSGKTYNTEGRAGFLPYAYLSGKNYSVHNPNIDLDGNVLNNAGNIR